MSRKYKAAFLAIIVLGFLSVAGWYLHGTNIAVLNAKGPIARRERDLMYTALALSLLLVVPVFTLTGVFAWRYREGNKKATYSPDLAGNKLAETVWWIIPSAIILVLAVITWKSAHTLDPYKPLSSSKPPLTIQVVALDWKWLFLYPEQHIASVNFFQFPVNTPLNFEITADAPMNSFWIPQLGGQIYAMPGMSTQLHLMASSPGSFNGSSANISGDGFAGMTFTAKASSQAAFDSWVKSVSHASQQLGSSEYAALAQPSENNPPSFYSAAENGLYYKIVGSYMSPGGQAMGSGSNNQAPMVMSMPGMDMQ